MYRRTETPLQLIQPAGRVCICVWDSQHLLLSTRTASLHLLTLWSNLGKRKTTAREAPQNEERSARGLWKPRKRGVKHFTSVVFDGEVVVVGNLWSKAEGEVLPVAHFVFVHRRNGFNDLITCAKTPLVSNGDVERPLNYRPALLRDANIPSLALQTRTWGPRCW